MASAYHQRIRETLAALGVAGRDDPRHVEAFMRVEHVTLDGLTPAEFRRDVEIAIQCIWAAESGQAEALAQSYGL